MLKILEITMDIHHFTKLPLLGFFNKKSPKLNLNKNFYVFTGSTVGVVPILGKGFYNGKIEKLGSVSTKII